MICLNSGRLCVEIAEPEEAPGAQTRFDLSGFIRQVTLDGCHWFCTEEPVRPDLPCTMGAGICSEIVWLNAPEFAEGSWFPKFGVGMLRQEDCAPYSFRRRYVHRLTPVSCRVEEASAFFETESENVRGYRLKSGKQVLVEGNRLTVRYRFQNTGDQELLLREYSHNFLTLDGLETGEDYYLEMPVKNQDGKVPEKGCGTLYGKGKGFSYHGVCGQPCAIRIMGEELEPGAFYWRLTHKKSEASVIETDSFRPARVLVWTVGCNISPEVSNIFSLMPGEKYSYERTWIFEASERKE